MPINFFCQICGTANHLVINCWCRFDYSYQKEDLPQSLAAIKLNDEHDPSFYVDFRATARVTNDTSKLSYVESYKAMISYLWEMEMPYPYLMWLILVSLQKKENLS